jgi:hypothetical protein
MLALSFSAFDPHRSLHRAPTVDARHCCSGYGQLVSTPLSGPPPWLVELGLKAKGK